jgi:16S rRNA processing protein RimM
MPAPPPSFPSDHVLIGRVVKAHGVRGALRVRSDGEALLQLKRVFLDQAPKRVLSARRERDSFLLELEGVEDRDRAEALRGVPLYCLRSELPAAADGELYVTDLVGCEVIGPDGARLGEVAEVVGGGTQDLLRVRSGASEFLLPFVEPLVRAVDVAARRIEADPPDGLVELNAASAPATKKAR